MATSMHGSAGQDGRHHKRSTSSKLMSMINPLGHRRNPSAGATLANNKFDENYSPDVYVGGKALPYLPSDHPHAGNMPLGELQQGRSQKVSPSFESKEGINVLSREPWVHKKTLSSTTFIASPEKEKKRGRGRSKTVADGQGNSRKHSKKSRSQSNLAALFSRPKSSKSSKSFFENAPQDKENQAPPLSSDENPPPIYAQFASQPLEDHSHVDALMRTHQRFDVDTEISLYTPSGYSASQQRNFYGAPLLTRRPSEQKARPMSEIISSNTSLSAFQDGGSDSRKSSYDHTLPNPSGRTLAGLVRRLSAERGSVPAAENSSRRTSEERKPVQSRPAEKLTIAKRGSRVMAAVTALNNKAKETEKWDKRGVKDIEGAFEALLESRNIPQNMREKMRALDINIKTDFVEKDKAETQSTLVTATPTSNIARTFGGTVTSTAVDKNTGKKCEGNTGIDESHTQEAGSASPNKRARPRSRNFTLHKGENSSSKKLKSSSATTSSRVKSTDLASDGNSSSLASLNPNTAIKGAFRSKSKHSIPEDFIAYLRKVHKLESFEIAKLHKLRQLLRNERVSWVDSFITLGGMDEIVGLLTRIMAVEWREEHEDSLLHESLLCLKALCTTALALQKLLEIQMTLFPALLGMLFDEENKGPSEFSTRSIIISIIFTHLATAPPNDLAVRARTILGYLKDQAPPKDAQPLDFVASMQKPRPYRVWCKEVVNVTKEVFWIFLHNLNVIPNTAESDSVNETFAQTHFPKERPPVPAAPYVGGVEWDATHYLAGHVDLMNALIASLPTREERNKLREELQVSGFERMMGNSLRTCKEKFYGHVHDGLRTWIGAANADEWDIQGVRMGMLLQERKMSPKKKREAKAEAPRIDVPKLSLGMAAKEETKDNEWVLMD